MENRKINIAEILRACPKGMELECTMFDNVTFELVDNKVPHPIKIRVGKTQFQRLTAFGEWYKTDVYQDYYTKCVIFPKGKNTWEGFVPPYKFKDGDIVCTTLDNIVIFKDKSGLDYSSYSSYSSYCGIFGNDDFAINISVSPKRLATEEEKAKLFKVIEKNSYRWDAETKTLEKLIKPKFKVGNRIVNVLMKDIGALAQKGVISEITDDMYIFTDGSFMFFDSQDSWELDPDKFDINTLVPFEDKVLVRDKQNEKWIPATWGFYDDSLKISYIVEGGGEFFMCIPYEGNEHLLGTKDDCDDFYKTWED